MNYYVISADGTKYGPADISTLNLWIADSRLVPTMQLEEEGTGRRIQAKDVIGLQFPAFNVPPQQLTGSPGPAQSYYYRPGQPAETEGKVEVIIAWILGVIGLGFCPIVISSSGIVLALQAKKKGHSGAQAALYFCIVSLVVGVILGAILGYQNAKHMFGQ